MAGVADEDLVEREQLLAVVGARAHHRPLLAPRVGTLRRSRRRRRCGAVADEDAGVAAGVGVDAEDGLARRGTWRRWRPGRPARRPRRRPRGRRGSGAGRRARRVPRRQSERDGGGDRGQGRALARRGAPRARRGRGPGCRGRTPPGRGCRAGRAARRLGAAVHEHRRAGRGSPRAARRPSLARGRVSRSGVSTRVPIVGQVARRAPERPAPSRTLGRGAGTAASRAASALGLGLAPQAGARRRGPGRARSLALGLGVGADAFGGGGLLGGRGARWRPRWATSCSSRRASSIWVCSSFSPMARSRSTASARRSKVARSASCCTCSRVGVCSAFSTSGSGRTATTRASTTARPVWASAASAVSPAVMRSRARRDAGGERRGAAWSRASRSRACCWAVSVSSPASCSSGVPRQRPVRGVEGEVDAPAGGRPGPRRGR